jgi:hypothetical protein
MELSFFGNAGGCAWSPVAGLAKRQSSAALAVARLHWLFLVTLVMSAAVGVIVVNALSVGFVGFRTSDTVFVMALVVGITASGSHCLGDRQNEGLVGIGRCSVAGQQRQRVLPAAANAWSAGQGRRPIVIVDKGDARRQGSAGSDRRHGES